MITIVGTNHALPEKSSQKSSFNFQVSEPFQAKLKLSWYAEIYNNLWIDDIWQLLVKIKQQNSYQNKDGLDYEK